MQNTFCGKTFNMVENNFENFKNHIRQRRVFRFLEAAMNLQLTGILCIFGMYENDCSLYV